MNLARSCFDRYFGERVNPQRRKIFQAAFAAFCVIGAAAAIFVGHELFKNRRSLFVIFSVYVIILTGIVIFFGFRLIGLDRSKGLD